MKKYKKRKIIQNELNSIICDCCKKEFCNNLEIQEMISINRINGFGSIFEDESKLELDLCQYCIKKLLGPYLRIEERE